MVQEAPMETPGGGGRAAASRKQSARRRYGFAVFMALLALEALPAVYFYVRPEDPLHPPLAASLAGLGIFTGLGLVVAAIARSMYVARRRARDAGEEAEARRRE